MGNITEQQEVAQQISDAISRPVGFGDDVDEVIGSEGPGSLGESKGPTQSNSQEKRGASLGRGDSKSGMILEAEVSFLRFEVLSSPIQDELLEELEELEQEELARELLRVGDKEEEPPVKLPSVPSTHLPAEPGTQGCSNVSRTQRVG